MILLLDGEVSGLLVASIAHELCTGLICSQAKQGLWDDGARPVFGLVRGAQLQTLQIDPAQQGDLSAWATELSKLCNAHASSPPAAPGDAPGVASLINLPAHLAHAPRITFLTQLGSSSCTEATLRPALHALEQRRQHLEVRLTFPSQSAAAAAREYWRALLLLLPLTRQSIPRSARSCLSARTRSRQRCPTS